MENKENKWVKKIRNKRVKIRKNEKSVVVSEYDKLKLETVDQWGILTFKSGALNLSI